MEDREHSFALTTHLDHALAGKHGHAFTAARAPRERKRRKRNSVEIKALVAQYLARQKSDPSISQQDFLQEVGCHMTQPNFSVHLNNPKYNPTLGNDIDANAVVVSCGSTRHHLSNCLACQNYTRNKKKARKASYQATPQQQQQQSPPVDSNNGAPQQQRDISPPTTEKQLRMEQMVEYLSRQVFGHNCNPNPATMANYAMNLYALGFESVQFLQIYLKPRHLESFEWMPLLHKEIFLESLGTA